MFISYSLNELEQLREYPEREIAVAQGIENDIRQLLREEQLLEGPNVAMIQQQINFIKEEQRTLRERKKLVIEMYEVFADSKRKTSEKMSDANYLIQSLEDF